MILLQEFVDKYKGKGVDFDGHYGFQCVDLYRKYVEEVLGIPQTPSVAGAKDIWDKCPGFEKVTNTPDGFPKPGDVMIWGATYGPYGHVAIVVSADVNSFTCFSQNDPTGALSGIKKYSSYKGVVGWLRAVNDNTYRGYDLTNKESMKICVDQQIKVTEGLLVDKSQYEAVKGQLIEVTKQREDLSTELGKKTSALLVAEQSAKTAKEALQKELGDQLDFGDKWEVEQEEHSITKKVLTDLLWELEDELKLSHSIGDTTERISLALGSLQKLNQMSVLYEKQVKDLEAQVKKLNTYKKPIDKLSQKDLVLELLNRLLKRS